MEVVYRCRTSGVSINQYMHAGQNSLFNYFGEFMRNFTYPRTEIPPDYPMSNIFAKLSLHFSTGDLTTPQIAITKLQSKIESIVHTQTIDDENFDHINFALSVTAHEKVYSKILSTWEKYSAC